MSGLGRRIELFSAWSGASRFPPSLPLQHRRLSARRRFTEWSLRRSQAFRRLPEVWCAAHKISCPSRPTLSVLAHSRYFHSALRTLQEPQRREEDIRHTTQSTSSAKPDEQKTGTSKDQGFSSDNNEGKQGQDSGEQEDGEQQKKKEDTPPPPPHGDKSPWQVFTDTLRTEFKASKEWNESTKALASGVNDFTQNENIKRAREAYSAASGAATSTGGKVFKSTGKAIGKSAAWTWETLPVKGLRVGVNATGRGIEKITRPVRETEAFKSVQNVIDDGSSSRYGGWSDKEERRRKREAREMDEVARGVRPARRTEPAEEDPEYVIPCFMRTWYKTNPNKRRHKCYSPQRRCMERVVAVFQGL